MCVYNQNEEFLNFDVEYINGYLAPIALIRDYITEELGFNFFFKKIGDIKSPMDSLNDEITWALERYLKQNELNSILKYDNKLKLIPNWSVQLSNKLNFWIGKGLTDSIKEERRTWKNNQDFVLKDFLEHLNLFFKDRNIEVYEFTTHFQTKLPLQWGWIKFDDFIFYDSQNTYLLHFDLSD